MRLMLAICFLLLVAAVSQAGPRGCSGGSCGVPQTAARHEPVRREVVRVAHRFRERPRLFSRRCR
jgi:hypothetical protein